MKIGKPSLLICDDDSLFHLAVNTALKTRFECVSAKNSEEALAILRKKPMDGMLLDIQMRTSNEGLEALPKLRELDSDMAIIMSSGIKDFQTVKEALRLGADDYIPKDFDPNDLAHVISRALERRALYKRTEQQNFEALEAQKQHILVGESAAIQKLRKTIEKIRESTANVVITGEMGTGKEAVARQLRKMRPDGSLEPFVAVDSSTIQGSMAESLLFGHEKGSFTGAEKTSKGVFEEANGGIVYFDEIANMPLEIQAKLLRVLQEKEISRLGSVRIIQLEFRVICASNQDLEKLANAGRFKPDLLERLNVLPIVIPPLRSRTEDILLLVEHFVKKQPSNALRFTQTAIDILKSYLWPGNVRELANVVAYVNAMTDGTEVEAADLPPKFRDLHSKSNSLGRSFYDRVADFEKAILQDEYSKSDKNISKLAVTLGMDRSHLYSKLKEHGIRS